MIYKADYASVYLAALYGADPIEIKSIDSQSILLNTEDKIQKQKTENKQQTTITPTIESGILPATKDNGGSGNAYEISIAGVFQSYADNISDEMKPLLAEDITDAIGEFGPEYILEAIHIAVRANSRNWRYIAGILKRWAKDGKPSLDKPATNSPTDPKAYVTGKYASFITTGADTELGETA